MKHDDPLISSEYEAFIKTIANPDVEAEVFTFTSAYVLKCTLTQGVDSVPVKLVSMQSPITQLKQKYNLRHFNGKFSPISGPVLTLRTSIDVVIVGDIAYLLTLAGENLFSMERAYKSVCHDAINEIESAGIISNAKSFRAIAETGHNPRKFVSFSRERLNALKQDNTRKVMSERFSIPLDKDSKFDTSDEKSADKLVRLLCNKGMIDPFMDTAVEVSGAKKWQ